MSEGFGVVATGAFFAGTATGFDAEALVLTGDGVGSAVFFTVSFLWRVAGPVVAAETAKAAAACERAKGAVGVIPCLEATLTDGGFADAAFAGWDVSSAALSVRLGNSPKPCKKETNSMAKARWSVNEAPHYVRH